MRSRPFRSLVVALSLSALASGGCNVLSPKRIAAKHQYVPPELVSDTDDQIEIGRPIPWLDTVGWVVGIPGKVMLWDRRIDNHRITSDTMETSIDYLAASNLPHVKVRINQYAPLEDFRRLRKNKTVAWPYRYTLGILAVGGEAILPGRVVGGDHFNPFTQTVHIYSDVPAIALHELAHAKDFTRREYQGTYALAYTFFPMWHETIASRDAMSYLYDRSDAEGIAEANRILYPAYGTYVGSALGNFAPAYSMPIYYGSVIAGHVNGRMLNRQIGAEVQRHHEILSSSTREQDRTQLGETETASLQL
ncbi:hypothetical protein Poly51_32320 [Rubripirellula tenax]|uniref:Uncharacterized protein n=1 Tax=Rubripirellula tenax TaxID=2528015 RepID=A0A5C6EY02_9BACT|nr:hypothetical protein [Rubripirellula tenax]TWU54513.1 hypothetical protein Poly51_32320 [Rubripirellula tenax]